MLCLIRWNVKGLEKRCYNPRMPELHLSPIGQIAVRARDVERATAFYRDTLGMRHLFSVPGKLSFFDCGGVRLMLDLPEGEHDHPSSILYFKVVDINQAFAAL